MPDAEVRYPALHIHFNGISMKTLIHHTLGLLAMFLSGQGIAATYTTPDGMWDIVSNTSILIKTDSGRTTETLNQVLSQAQYVTGNSYRGDDWQGIQGRWKQAGNAYQVELDIAGVNSSKTSPAYVNRVINKFTDYATRLYGIAPTLTRIELRSFTDKSRLNTDGLKLQGTSKSTIVVTYNNPKTGQPTSAKLRLSGTYRGQRASAPSGCCTSTDSARNQTKSRKFLDQNAELPGILKTATGLQYKIIQKASGANPKPLATDTVKVSYRGYLPSGQVFDSNAGISFPLSGVIAGWTEGLQLMSVGDYFRFYIPPELAYGDRTIGSYIKPNSALVFDVILEAIE